MKLSQHSVKCLHNIGKQQRLMENTTVFRPPPNQLSFGAGTESNQPIAAALQRAQGMHGVILPTLLCYQFTHSFVFAGKPRELL